MRPLVFASRAVLTGLEQTIFPDVGWARSLVQLTQWVLSVLTVAGISGIVFKAVPDTRIGWRAVTRGALLTSLFFNVGNWLVGLYLGRAAVASTYGVAGSAIVVLIWLYFSAQMFLFGAELTQVYARHFGRGLSRSEAEDLEHAERLAEQDRSWTAER